MALSNIPSLRRKAKNVAYNYSDAQVKVREATSNDPWGPSSSLMSEVADMTYNAMAFTEIMQMIWKRINDHGKNWRHVYKSLVLLDYLIKTGSEKVAHQCKENIFAIQTLKDFQHIEDNKDQGINVREKAKQLVALLKDDERLKNERARALMAKKRFTQNGMGIGSDGSTHQPRHSSSDTFNASDDTEVQGATFRRTRRGMRHGVSVPNLNRRQSELDDARPATTGEEEIQLQIALALSREEAAKEEELRRGDDARYRMALEESKRAESHPSADQSQQQRSSAFAAQSSAMDDLLALGNFSGGGVKASNDPWGAPPPASGSVFDDRAPVDPWMPAGAGSKQPLRNDPWSPTTATSDAVSGTRQTNASWSFDAALEATDVDGSLSNGHGMEKQRQLRTPENFLGENSSLVNLDNLMGPPKSSAMLGAPTAKASTNPFGAFSATHVAPTNPFLAQQRPSPTLNQMRASTTSTSQKIGGGQGGHAGPGSSDPAWTLPQPLQPQSSSVGATNPFL